MAKENISVDVKLLSARIASEVQAKIEADYMQKSKGGELTESDIASIVNIEVSKEAIRK